MLMTHGLRVAHGARVVLDDVSFAVAPGKLTVLLGRNGAGKSTLLKALAGAAGAGSTTLNDEPLHAIRPARLALLRAVLPQSSTVAFAVDAQAVVRLGRHPHRAAAARHGEAGEQAIVRAALALAGVAHLAARDASTLSGGELARVQFARVLAQLWPAAATRDGEVPRYLLLDEPTAALDLAHQHQLLATVRTLTRAWGVGALAIVHDPNLAARHADRLALLADGRIAACGPPDVVMRSDELDLCYGLALQRVEQLGDRPPLVVAV
jgi:iron complex transport system ATP-binding protein